MFKVSKNMFLMFQQLTACFPLVPLLFWNRARNRNRIRNRLGTHPITP